MSQTLLGEFKKRPKKVGTYIVPPQYNSFSFLRAKHRVQKKLSVAFIKALISAALSLYSSNILYSNNKFREHNHMYYVTKLWLQQIRV